MIPKIISLAFNNLNDMKELFLTVVCLTFCVNLLAQNIHRTACNGNLVRLDSMLANKGIDVQDDRGRSLLHWAVACKKKDIFDFLVQKGIAINGVDNQGKTPLHFAVQFNNEEFLDYLIQVQPNDDWQSVFGSSLLELAVLNKNKALIQKLVASGIGINGTNKRGSTALEIAERIGALDIAEYVRSLGADTSLVRVFKMEGEYMGQEKPGTSAKMFAPNFISTEEQEFGSVFNADGTEFYFGVDMNGKNEIRYSKLDGNQWTKPIPIVSHERYSYNDPFLSNDETRLYYISTSAKDSKGEPDDIDIWYSEKTLNGWSKPINAGGNINTEGNEYYISFTKDGTMYFSSNGHSRKDSSRTDHDIYFSKFIENEFQEPVLLGESVNTTSYEADVFVSPDESYLIFCSTRDGGYGRGDLYICFRTAEGKWTPAVNMGNRINTEQYEYCPFVTKDGKYLFFTSNQDIYWIETEILQEITRRKDQ